MKKTSTPKIKSSVRRIFHTAKTRLTALYDEFADIIDTDEDRLSLQFNQMANRASRFFPKSFKLRAASRKA